MCDHFLDILCIPKVYIYILLILTLKKRIGKEQRKGDKGVILRGKKL